MKKDKEYFKCPKCGSTTYDDSFGYSPPVPECRKCKHLCNWQHPEDEASGLDDKIQELHKKHKKFCKRYKKANIEPKYCCFGFGLLALQDPEVRKLIIKSEEIKKNIKEREHEPRTT